MGKIATSSVNLSLPAQLRRYLESKVAAGVYGSMSEVIEEALREKQARDREQSRKVLEEKLLEGLNSGKAKPFRGFDAAKRRLMHRKSARKSGGPVRRPSPPVPSSKALKALKQLAKENRIPQRWIDDTVDPTVE